MPKERRAKRKPSAAIWVLSAVIVVLCVIIAFISAAYYSQTRLNRFSKNIIFSDNYFLRNYAFDTEETDKDERPESYTYNEARAITGELIGETGIVNTTDEIFTLYRPDRELSITDIYGYYYNTVRSSSERYLCLYFLFLPQIRGVTGITEDRDEDTYTKDEMLSFLYDMVEYSLEWYPRSTTVIYTENGSYVQTKPNDDYRREEYIDSESEEFPHAVMQNVIDNAILLLAGSEYEVCDFDAVCRLYYDSVSRAIIDDRKMLSTVEIQKHLYSDEYGTSKMKILDVEHISQLPEYPNGCEPVSAVMLLHYAGYDVSRDSFISNHLEKGEVKIRFGIRFGPDPEEKYAGDPASEKGGWGCFSPVIVNALNSYLEGKDHVALNVSGATLDALCDNFIDSDIPVAIWVTEDFSPLSEVYQWLDPSRENVYLYPKNQHCVVLVGYDRQNYYFCDPLKTDSIVISVPKEDVAVSFASMGSQAVVVTPRS